MEHVHTAYLLSEPCSLSPAWKLVFQTLTKPIRLILTLRERLTTDLRQVPEGLLFWLNDLQDYNNLLGEGRDRIDETLAMLDSAAAFETWNIGHQIRTAINAVFSDLAGVSGFFRPPDATPAERHAQILDFRRRAYASSKKLNERPLLEALRRAVAKENQIPLEVAWMNPRETNAHFGIHLPGGKHRSPTVSGGVITYESGEDRDEDAEPGQTDVSNGEGARKLMSVDEANDEAMKLAAKFGPAFFVMSVRTQVELIGCHYRTWKKTPFYLKAVEEGKIVPSKPRAAKADSLTSGREAVFGEGQKDEILTQVIEQEEGMLDDSELRRLIAESQKDNKKDPSPLEVNPTGRKRKLHSRTRP
jgi:hypothetical protein